MAEKIVKLRLDYKGKPLDFAKKGNGAGDIRNKWFIGSNKHMFWQILDSKFPEKHLFLVNKKDEYFLNILPSSELTCKKGGQVVDKGFLKSKNLLSGTQLKITPDMSGTVVLTKDWSINFEFVDPFKRILSPEEKQIISLYSRRAELAPSEKKNRNMLLFITLFTLIFLFVYDSFLKREDAQTNTIEESFDRIIAQKVDAPRMPTRAERDRVAKQEDDQEAAGEAAARQQAAQAAAQKRTEGLKALAGSLGALGGEQGDGGRALQAATTIRTIKARSFGDSGGGRGTGAGQGAGGSGGYEGFGDPSLRAAAAKYQGEISRGRIGGGGSLTDLQGKAIEQFRGDASTIKRGERIASEQALAALRNLERSGQRILKENEIPQGDEETRSAQEKVNQNIGKIRQRLASTYNRFSSTKVMTGSINFKVAFDTAGNVSVVPVVVSGDDFERAFIEECVRVIEAAARPMNLAGKGFEFTQVFRRG